MSYEKNLESGLFSSAHDKTYIDKVLAQKDVDRIRELVKKPKLARSDILEILYLLSGTESKLVNYGEWDRYVILKFFVWLREFVKVAELLYDYQEDISKRIHLSPRTKRIIDNNENLIGHNVKFLIDLYLNISRTTLSIGATGLLELLKSKFEVSYTGNALASQQPQQVQAPVYQVKTK